MMKVEIVNFPMTKVAAIEHVGAPALEHVTAKKLVAWKLEHRLLDPAKYRSYGVHYTDSRTANSTQHRVDFCLSYDGEIAANPYGVVAKVIPALRCARARDVGSRFNNKAAPFLYEQWLRQSGEVVGDFPMIFHYVNVGPNIKPEDMITDVYLPIR